MRRAVLAAGIAVCVATTAPAGASTARDSLLQDYLDRMRDSTDAFFGITALPTDTTGLDSTLAARLLLGTDARRESRARAARRVRFAPALGFQRVDGLLAGASAEFGSARGTGRLDGRLQWAGSAEALQGGAAYTLRRGSLDEGARTALSVRGERVTVPFDRDFFSPQFAALSALQDGSDRHSYFMRTGAELSLTREHAAGLIRVALRDHVERTRTVATDWNLLDRDLALADNLAAREGRARELRFAARSRLPRVPWTLEGQYATSGRQLASDFTYRRMRIALAGDIGLVDRLALVPQFEYGRLRGEPVPQQAFFLGGADDLRTLDRNALRGAGRTVARLDLLYTGDALTRLRVPHPAWLTLSPVMFATSAATWGRDAASGALAETRRDGPRAEEWHSEAGVGCVWRLGVPEPDVGLRLDAAWPLGPEDGRGFGVTLTIQRAFGLLRVR